MRSSRHDPAGRGALDRRGVPRRPRHGADRRTPLEIAVRLRQAARDGSDCLFPSASPARSIWPRSPAGLEAGRAAAGATRARARVPPRAARRAGLGHRARDRDPAVPHRDRHRGPARAVPRERARHGHHRRAAARQLHALANNRDPRPVRRRPPPRSIGSQHAFGRRDLSPAELETDLVAIVDRVTRRLRAARRVGRTVVLRLRFDDYTRATRSQTLRHPTAQNPCHPRHRPRSLLAEAQPLIRERGLTLVGITIANLQNDLPFSSACPSTRTTKTSSTRPRPRSATASARCHHPRRPPLGRRPALELPLLPD